MLLVYPKGKSAFVSAAFGAYFRSTYALLGSKAQITMERACAVHKDRAVKIFLDSDDIVKEIVVAPADQFRLRVEDFCKEITFGNKSAKKYEEDMLAQAHILEAGRISHAEKRSVGLSEVN